MLQRGRKSIDALLMEASLPEPIERAPINIPSAPPHLSMDAARLWRAVTTEYDLGEPHLMLLRLACESFDRGEQARQAIALDGALIATDGGGIKSHPAITVERDSRIAFARLLRELDLDASAIDGPPPLKSNRG